MRLQLSRLFEPITTRANFCAGGFQCGEVFELPLDHGAPSTLGNGFGQAEVEHLRMPTAVYDYVARFDIAMNDVVFVCVA